VKDVCEVKSSSNDKIDPSLSVTLAKRTKLRKLYEVFITRHPNKVKMQPRFDVISTIFQKNDAPELEHISNAF
jgi:Holliday junction resolvase-like predicted endonuclease